jgi:glycosyltransferase involved in cell wall biosynthesis
VSVVVCTHTDRRIGLLLECVGSLASGSLPPREVLVVVDSNAELLDRLSEVLPPEVGVLASEGSGVSQARNTGIAAATGEVVAFIDDDALAEPVWLEELSRPFGDPGIVATGGRAVPRWERPNRYLPDELLWVVGCTYAGHPTSAQPVSRPIGCTMAIRRDALYAIGGFSKDFGPTGAAPKSHSNEELALAVELRAKYGPECIWYCPTAVVRHFVPAERTTWGYLWQRCIAEGISKADLRLRFGGTAMDYDSSYARRTLLPAIWRYSVSGVLRADASAGARALAGAGGLLVTAAAYGARSVSRRLRS